MHTYIHFFFFFSQSSPWTPPRCRNDKAGQPTKIWRGGLDFQTVTHWVRDEPKWQHRYFSGTKMVLHSKKISYFLKRSWTHMHKQVNLINPTFLPFVKNENTIHTGKSGLYHTWRSKPCSTERAVADSGRAIVSIAFPLLSPVSKRLTSCNTIHNTMSKMQI